MQTSAREAADLEREEREDPGDRGDGERSCAARTMAVREEARGAPEDPSVTVTIASARSSIAPPEPRMPHEVGLSSRPTKPSVTATTSATSATREMTPLSGADVPSNAWGSMRVASYPPARCASRSSAKTVPLATASVPADVVAEK